MWRDDAYLLDMLLATRKVQQFTQGVTWNQFRGDELLQNAVMRLIQIVGEAARKVSPEFKQAHPEIPWQGSSGCTTGWCTTIFASSRAAFGRSSKKTCRP